MAILKVMAFFHKPIKDDDLSDLTSDQQSQLNDWYESLSMKYDKVGNIIKEVFFFFKTKSKFPRPMQKRPSDFKGRYEKTLIPE